MPPFLVFAVAASLLPAIFYLDLPDGLVLPLFFLLRVILPAVLASAVFALATLRFEDGTSSGAPGLSDLRPHGREIVAAGLFSGMIALALVVFAGPLGRMLLPLFYGPPILIQVIAAEGLPLREAWPRTRQIMRGAWGRTILALLLVVILIGMLGALVLGSAAAVTDPLGSALETTLLVGVQVLALGLTLPFLAAAQYVLYRDVSPST